MADTANVMRLYNCGGAAYYQCFCRCDRWIYCFHSLSCGVCLLGESVSYGKLSYDHQKQQNCALGMDAAAGIISCIIVMVVSIVSGSVYFNRKNIL